MVCISLLAMAVEPTCADVFVWSGCHLPIALRAGGPAARERGGGLSVGRCTARSKGIKKLPRNPAARTLNLEKLVLRLSEVLFCLPSHLSAFGLCLWILRLEAVSPLESGRRGRLSRNQFLCMCICSRGCLL
ncbi:Protein Hexim1 [Manis pentadactyla]|nr:Protein Hexim1 [Manis pentadactyla]